MFESQSQIQCQPGCQFQVVLGVEVVIPNSKLPIEQARHIQRGQHVAQARPVRCAVLAKQKVRERAEDQATQEVEVGKVVMPSIDPASEPQGVAAARVGDIILKSKSPLPEGDGLSVSTKR